MSPRAPTNSYSEILAAALECFVDNGYHGTSVRDIAAKAKISVPGLYHHFSSKNEILFTIMNQTMEDLVRTTREALRSVPADPATQLAAAVRVHVLFNTMFQSQSFVGGSELRSLIQEQRKAIIAKREQQQRFFDSILEEGTRLELFGVPYPHDASRAIVTMCTAVGTWYRPTGPLSPEEIARRYAAFSLALASCSYEAAQAALAAIELAPGLRIPEEPFTYLR